MRTARYLLLAIGLGMLGACTNMQARLEGVAPGMQLMQLQRWQVTGRIAIATRAEGGTGRFHWQQQGAHSVIQLTGPVGIGSLQIQAHGDDVVLQTADGQQYQSPQAMAALQARLGVMIPIRQLRYWLLGLAAPGAHRWVSVEGSVLEQDAWRIEYTEFVERQGVRLPTKITATAGDNRIRILLEHWQLYGA